jgi:RNA polymerase sigma factor (sigma-70 family)
MLCATYRRPVEGVFRARGCSVEDAEDLAQEFFLKLFERQIWKRVDQEKGRFRTFLMKVLLDMLASAQTARTALKRGGRAEKVSLEVLADSGEEPSAPDEEVTLGFDRDWAKSVMRKAIEDVEKGFAAAGKARDFGILKSFLPGMGPAPSAAEAALQLGSSEGAIKVAVHRLRGELRESLRKRVATTVRAAHEVDEELSYLRQVLNSGL